MGTARQRLVSNLPLDFLRQVVRHHKASKLTMLLAVRKGILFNTGMNRSGLDFHGLLSITKSLYAPISTKLSCVRRPGELDESSVQSAGLVPFKPRQPYSDRNSGPLVLGDEIT